jgi:hypothetical protein
MNSYQTVEDVVRAEPGRWTLLVDVDPAGECMVTMHPAGQKDRAIRRALIADVLVDPAAAAAARAENLRSES